MKVKIITGKYKPAEGDVWYKTDEVVDLPEAEGMAAIVANVAVVLEVPTVQPVIPPIEESSPRRGGRTAKEE